jgi:hypothetical protein
MLRIAIEVGKKIGRAIRDTHRAAPWRTWIALAAFLVSFGYALTYQITPSVDARKFNTIAINLVTKNTFCFTCDVPLEKDWAIRDIGPGYQFFLAGMYTVFGIRLWVVWLMQALMHAIVCWWLYGMLKKNSGSERGTEWHVGIPIALYAFHPDVVQNVAMLMSENLFVFILVGLAGLCIQSLEKEDDHPGWRWVVIGILGGILMMVRPTGLPFVCAASFFLMWQKKWKTVLVLLVCVIAIQTPWAIRNERLYNHFILNSVVGGLDFWVGLDPYSPGVFNMDALPHITSKIQGLEPDQIDRVSIEETKKIIAEKPLFAIGRTLHKALKLFALTKTSAFWFHYHSSVDQLITLIGSVICNAVIWISAFAGLVEMIWRKKRIPPLIAFSILAVMLLAVAPTLTVVVNRYRIPMLPFAVLVMGYWLVITGSWRQRLRSLIVASLIIAVCTVADLWNSLPKVMDRVRYLRIK